MKCYFFFMLWAGAIAGVSVAALPGPGVPGPGTPIPASGSLLGRVDHDGIVTTRSILQIGPSRWFLTTCSEIILREEREAPAGYRGRSLSLRSPLDEVRMNSGVEAGPVILGPIEGKGMYHRLRDPTAGGVRWAALTDRSRFAAMLDPVVQDRRGVALASGDAFSVAGGALWYLERDDRYRVEGGDGWFSPLPDHRLGRVGLLLARVDLDDDLLPDFRDERWLFTTPPLRSTESRRQALFWEYDHRRREELSSWAELVQPRFLIEGWRYRGGTGVPRHAGTSFLQLGPPWGRISLRATAAEAGFRTLEGSRPAHSRLLAAELNHRSVYPLAILESSAGWTRVHRWDEGRPGPPGDEQSASIALRRMRVARVPTLERLRISGVFRDEFYRWTASAQFLGTREAGSAETRRVLTLNRTVRSDLEASMDSDREWRLAAGFTLITPAPWPRSWFSDSHALNRVVSASISGGLRGAGDTGVDRRHATGEGSLPVGRRYRGSVRIRVEQETMRNGELEWSGLLTVEYAW